MRFEVLILGNSSATPAYGRHPTSQVLRTNTQQFLIDCGEGTQIQFQKYKVKFKNLNNILISHLHGDHFYGLIGLITSFNLNGRKSPLTIYCPEGLDEIIEVHLRRGQIQLSFEIVYNFLSETNEAIYTDDEISIYCFPLEHRIATFGFLFQQNERKRRLIPEKIKEFDLSIEEIKLLKDGRDVERSTQNLSFEDLTVESTPPKSYAFVSDTIPTRSYMEIARNVDLLYHEATFTEDLADRAKDTFHSTARQAAEIANELKAKKLIIGHFSARFQDVSIFLNESKQVFPNTEIAEEGKTFEI